MKRPSMGTRHLPWTLTLALAVALAACASGAGGAGGSSGSADVITQAQIDEAALDNALEVVRRYRPRWLQPVRPTASAVAPVVGHPGMPQRGSDQALIEVYPTVVQDGARLGEISSLASISSRTVASIRFVNPTDARTRYGTGYDGGVIEVVSR